MKDDALLLLMKILIVMCAFAVTITIAALFVCGLLGIISVVAMLR